jgi:hypothetical protein
MGEKTERLLVIATSFILAGALLITSLVMLPENCYLVETRNTGLLCDGMDVNNPQPCPICRDNQTRRVGQIVFGFGIVVFFLPLAIYGLRVRSKRLYDEERDIDLKLGE